ncbi:MAG: undecaprenyl-diphosphatase UppP [Deltaproteobacteria bacterium]|nr:undecaprenyl-diphosphatase UppP [Deltaproteobacteria bacterium]
MTLLNAAILGLVQGLTEFLPVSSSGHLVIVQHLLHFTDPNLAFDVVLHLGTLLAVFIYFGADLRKILSASLGKGDSKWRRVGLLILLGTVPTGVIGVLFKDVFERLFSSPETVVWTLAVTGLLLFTADRVKRADRPLSGIGVKDAILIGVVQGISVIPGISRSGSTIATGLYRRIEARAAARFSFLLSIPAILGAVVLEGKDILGHTVGGSGAAFFVGFMTAAVSGWLAIRILMALLVRRGLTGFALYCWGVAAITFFWIV